jgi:hypothetical protein
MTGRQSKPFVPLLPRIETETLLSEPFSGMLQDFLIRGEILTRAACENSLNSTAASMELWSILMPCIASSEDLHPSCSTVLPSNGTQGPVGILQTS